MLGVIVGGHMLQRLGAAGLIKNKKQKYYNVLNRYNVYLCKIFISKVANEQSSQKKKIILHSGQ